MQSLLRKASLGSKDPNKVNSVNFSPDINLITKRTKTKGVSEQYHI